MKKKSGLIFIIAVIIFVLLFNVQQQFSHASEDKSKTVIPKDAIRLRILANSDRANDQTVKRDVRDAVNRQIETWVQNLTSFEEAKKVIQAHLPEIREIVKRELKKEHANPKFTVKLGKADFPTKLYGGMVYQAGNYQALVITLGSGQGANWWCVLFPPLCFLDFAHGDAVQPDATTPSGGTSTGNMNNSTTAAQHALSGEGLSPQSPSNGDVGQHPSTMTMDPSPSNTMSTKRTDKSVSTSHSTVVPDTEPTIHVKFLAWEWIKKATQLFG